VITRRSPSKDIMEQLIGTALPFEMRSGVLRAIGEGTSSTGFNVKEKGVVYCASTAGASFRVSKQIHWSS
jgi:hypothetical protein